MYRRQLRRAFPLPWSEPDEDDEGGGIPGWGWALIAFIVVVLIITLAVLPLGFPCKTYDIYGWCPCNPPENKEYNSDKKICSCKPNYVSLDPKTKPCTECTDNKIPNTDKTLCICKLGYTDNNGTCVLSSGTPGTGTPGTGTPGTPSTGTPGTPVLGSPEWCAKATTVQIQNYQIATGKTCNTTPTPAPTPTPTPAPVPDPTPGTTNSTWKWIPRVPR